MSSMTVVQEGPSRLRRSVTCVRWDRGARAFAGRTVMDSVVPYLCNFFFCYLHSPRRQVSRTVIGTTVRRGSLSKTHQLLESGYLDHFSELHDEPVGRTIIATTDRHKLRNPTLGQSSPSSFSSCTTLPPTDHHKHDGPS